MINNTVLVGRLTRTPELRSTQTGVPVTNFTIACNRNFGDKDQADFINCVAWRHSAEFLCNYMQKGNLIGVVGRIQSRTYEDNGKTVYVQEVVAEQVQALESKANRENNQSYQNNDFNKTNNFNQNNTYNTNTANTRKEEPVLDISSDDLPF